MKEGKDPEKKKEEVDAEGNEGEVMSGCGGGELE